jgi:hypothetical protein
MLLMMQCKNRWIRVDQKRKGTKDWVAQEGRIERRGSVKVYLKGFCFFVLSSSLRNVVIRSGELPRDWNV